MTPDLILLFVYIFFPLLFLGIGAWIMEEFFENRKDTRKTWYLWRKG